MEIQNLLTQQEQRSRLVDVILSNFADYMRFLDPNAFQHFIKERFDIVEVYLC